jgi:hypothetical protein
MYQDNESIRQFEKQHARDTLRELARKLPDQPDTDLMTAHLAMERTKDRLSVRISLIAVAALTGLTVLLFLT